MVMGVVPRCQAAYEWHKTTQILLSQLQVLRCGLTTRWQQACLERKQRAQALRGPAEYAPTSTQAPRTG